MSKAFWSPRIAGILFAAGTLISQGRASVPTLYAQSDDLRDRVEGLSKEYVMALGSPYYTCAKRCARNCRTLQAPMNTHRCPDPKQTFLAFEQLTSSQSRRGGRIMGEMGGKSYASEDLSRITVPSGPGRRCEASREFARGGHRISSGMTDAKIFFSTERFWA